MSLIGAKPFSSSQKLITQEKTLLEKLGISCHKLRVATGR